MDARAPGDGAADPVKARTICLHGPESTGKSTLAQQLADHFRAALVPEYGRTYCEAHGTDLSMAQLVEIARTHDTMTCAALLGAASDGLVILDTDPLMTAVWAEMLHGRRDPWFDTWHGTADLYLLPDIDLPWRADALRMFGDPADRRRFFDLSRAELEHRGVRWAKVRGEGANRFVSALAAIAAADI
jgi:NadR type nicotinamide-nucleotide adenylyltransferase